MTSVVSTSRIRWVDLGLNILVLYITVIHQLVVYDIKRLSQKTFIYVYIGVRVHINVFIRLFIRKSGGR
jgi:uncharacterized membrane protein